MGWWPSGGGLLPSRIRPAPGGALWTGLSGPTSRMLVLSLAGLMLCLGLQQQLRHMHSRGQGPHSEQHLNERFPGVAAQSRLPEPAAQLVMPVQAHFPQPKLEDGLFVRRTSKGGSEVLVQPATAFQQLNSKQGAAGNGRAPPTPASGGGVGQGRPGSTEQARALLPQLEPESGNVGSVSAELIDNSAEIGVFVYAEGMGRLDAVDSVECYAARHGYKFFLGARQQGDECSSMYPKSVYYRKQCYAAKHLRGVGWLLVLDADSAIVSAGRRIEEWIDSSKDVILYERWLSGELMAGNYLVRNSPAGRRFLETWLEFDSIQTAFSAQRKEWFSNADNGALHLVTAQLLMSEGKQEWPVQPSAKAGMARADQRLAALMQAKFGQQPAPIQECTSLYAAAVNLPGYDKFVACARHLIAGLLKTSKSIKVYRRGHGFCIDNYVAADMYNPTVGHMCLHGVKSPVWNKLTSRIDTAKCKAEPKAWEVPMQPALRVGVDRLQEQLKMKEKVHTNSRPDGWRGSGGVGACWPNCPELM
eukprot:jgi/Tetstr1/450117/TSEL_037160.t1